MPDMTSEETQDISVADLLSGTSGEAGATSNAGVSTETPTESTNGETLEAPAETGQETLPEPSLKDRVAELGFSDVKDDVEAQQRLIEAYSQQTQAQRQYQQQLEMLQFQMRAMLAQQNQGQPQYQAQQNTPSQPEPFYNPPPVDQALVNRYLVGRDEDGKLQWKPETPPQIIGQYQAREDYLAQHADRLVRNWDQVEANLEQRILAKAEELFQNRIQSHAQQQQAESFIQQQITENQDLLYQIDPVTKTVRRDFQGNVLLSEAGVRLEGILAELEQGGMYDEVSRWKYGMQLYKAQYGDLRQKAADQIQQSRLAAQAKQLAKQAAHVPARHGQEGTTLNGRPQRSGVGHKMFSNPDFSVSFGD